MWQGAKNIYHLFVAFLANIWCGFPSRKLTVIGVTGTDGKTTTVNAIFHVLKTAGMDVSMISTTGAVINGRDYDVGFHVTTPSSWKLQEFFKKAVLGAEVDGSGSCQSFSSRQCSSKSSKLERLRAGGKPSNSATPHNRYMVLELTSHALDQHRDWGINYEVGVLTNITNEHLDYHKTYENYVKAKTKLLLRSKLSIINIDDRSYNFVNSNLKSQNSKLQLKTKKVITYGIKNKADFNAKDLPIDLKAPEFNKYNFLAATAACELLGIKKEIIKKTIKTFILPPGRGEIVYHKDFDVMIDFAHTPNAFEQVLPSIRSKVNGQIIHVFGCAGQRDSEKRPEMGIISARYSDIIILTAEDPRSESVEEINKQIESGIFNFQFSIFSQSNNFQFEKKKKYYFKINDRQEAINIAIKIARSGDLVLLTGKAHEKSMNYGNGEDTWDEYEAVKKALKKRGLRLGR